MVPSVEVAKKPIDTFDVMLNYLVDDTGRATEIKDKALLLRMRIKKPLCTSSTAC